MSEPTTRTRRKTGAALAAAALMLGTIPAFTTPSQALAEDGTVTINQITGNAAGIKYFALQIFKADLNAEGNATDIQWTSNDAVKTAVLGVLTEAGFTGSTPQEALEFMNDKWTTETRGIVNGGTLENQLATALAGMKTSAAQANIAPGDEVTLSEGWYLFLTDPDTADDKQGAMATSAIFVPVNKDVPVTATEKTSIPVLTKQVKEDSSGTLGKYADAEFQQPLEYELKATLPGNYASFEAGSFSLVLEDTFDGLELVGLDSETGALVKPDFSGDASSVAHGNAVASCVDVFIKTADGTEFKIDRSATAEETEYAEIATPGTPQDVAYDLSYKDNKLTVNLHNFNNRVWMSDTGTDINVAKGIDKDSTVIIRYKAALTTDAQIGDTGNPNTAKLTYSNNPNQDSTGKTPEVETRTFAYKLQLLKVDQAVQTRALEGAKFTIQVAQSAEPTIAWAEGKDLSALQTYLNGLKLTWNETPGKTIATALSDYGPSTFTLDGSKIVYSFNFSGNPSAKEVYEVFESIKNDIADVDYAQFFTVTQPQQGAPVNTDTSSAGKYVQADGTLGATAYEFTTNDSGEIEVSGLDEGVYIIHETTPPTDYQALPGDITVTIGSSITESNNVPSVTLTNTVSGAQATSMTDMDDGTVGVKLTNVKLNSMPLTGQEGLVLSSIAGAAIVILGVTLTVRRNRSNKKNEEE